MADFFSTEGFWVLASFIAFIALVFKPAKNALLQMLDDKAMHIMHKLEEAAKVRKEAEDLLQAVQQQQAATQVEMAAILSKAKLEAESLIEDAKLEVEHITAKRRELALQKIAQEEMNIITDLKGEVLEESLKIVKKLLITELSNSSKMEMIEASINNLNKLVN